MRKRISLSLIMCLCLLLFTGSTVLAAENIGVIPDFGVITFPSNVTVRSTQLLKGNFPLNTLLAKDNDIWRSITLLFIPTPNINREAHTYAEYLEPAFNQLETYLNNDNNSKLLYNSSVNKLVINNEQLALKSYKFLVDGMVVHKDFYIMQGINGGIGIAIVYLDCDSEYWSPKITKMIADIKRIGAK